MYNVGSNLTRRFFLYFYFPVRKVCMRYETRKREIDVFVCFFARVRVNVNIHMITLQLLVNQERRTTNIRS